MPDTVILEQRPKRLSRATRNSLPVPSNITLVQSAPIPIPGQSKKRRNQRGRNSKRKGNKGSLAAFKATERSFYRAALLAPDVFGPFRQPRAGGSDRTGLGYDQTYLSLTGTATPANYQLAQAGSKFNGGVDYTATPLATTGTAIGALTDFVPNTQFPATNQVADVNLVACSLVAYYTGNPLNVQGEIILGSCIPIATNSNYATLFYYPGTLHFPVANIINKPMRVSMRKLSPVADEFVAISVGNADVDLPFIGVTGLPSGGTVVIIMTRCWEYRSTTVSGNVIPYEKVGPGHSSDFAAFIDAKADLAEKTSTLTEAFPDEGASTAFLETLGLPAGLAALGGAAAVGIPYAAQNLVGRLRGGNSRRASNMESMIPLQRYVQTLSEMEPF